MRALLDTHILLWWFESKHKLSAPQRRVIDRASVEPLWVSDISIWEISVLYEMRRIRLHMSLREWLERATAAPLVERIGISPAVAEELALLPSTFHRDPADRILVATARVLGAKLVTCDKRIVASRVVPTIV